MNLVWFVSLLHLDSHVPKWYLHTKHFLLDIGSLENSNATAKVGHFFICQNFTEKMFCLSYHKFNSHATTPGREFYSYSIVKPIVK